MTTALQIRLLDPTELDALREIRLRAIEDTPDAFLDDYDEWAAKPPEAFARFFKGHVAAAFLGEQIVGMATLSRYEGRKLKHKGMIGAVYVAPEARGRGAAKKLLLLLEEKAQSLDIEQLSLATNINNPVTIGLYEGLGYIACGVEMHILKMPDGSYIDDVQMIKFLR